MGQSSRSGDDFATYHEPDEVRGSNQVNAPNIPISSFWKSVISMRFPASRTTTEIPFFVSSFASVPPPAPEPMITTTEESFRSNFAGIFPHSWILFRQPIYIAETAMQIAAL